MRISLEEARRIARLAHLRFSEDELQRLRGQLDLILDYVSQIDDRGAGDPHDASDAPGARACRPADLREDAPGSTLAPEAALGNAPDAGEGHFRVPRIIP